MKKETIIKNTRINDEKFVLLFANKFKFSKNLIKYEDSKLYDMYDHNYFYYKNHISRNEIIEASNYQLNKGLDFLKIISYTKMSKITYDFFGLKEDVCLTMIYDGDINKIKINNKVKIKRIKISHLQSIEHKHYGKIYGDDFVNRRNKEFFNLSKREPNFIYYGAYINNKLVGACHIFVNNGLQCMDSLLVDNRYRKKYVASTLIKYFICNNNSLLYLHSDFDDYPYAIYKKMGFKIIDKSYEYVKKLI